LLNRPKEFKGIVHFIKSTIVNLLFMAIPLKLCKKINLE